MYNIYELNDKTLDDLKIIAIELGIDDEGRSKQQLIYDIIDHQVEHPETVKKSQDAAPKKRGRKPKNQGAQAPVEATPEKETQQKQKKEKQAPKEEAPKKRKKPKRLKKSPSPQRKRL